jgi:hypothetical protein
MDDLMSLPAAAEALEVPVNTLKWLHRRGHLDLHKQIGMRHNLVRLGDAREALQYRQPVGWQPGRPRRKAKQGGPA